MTKLWDLDEDSLLSLMAGYNDKYANELSSQYEKDKAYSLSRILSTGLNRAFYRHLPQLVEGNIGWVVQSELGLYTTKGAKDKQKKLEKLSPEMMKALKELEKSGR